MNKKTSFKISFLLLFVLFATNNNHLIAQSAPGILVTPENFKKEIDLDTLYKYKIGDDPKWASVDFDDSSWRPTEADSTDNDTLLQKHEGIVWFRGKFKVDSSLAKNPFTIEILAYGAVDVYFDGKLVKKIGKVAAKKEDYKSGFSFNTTMIPVALNGQTEHLIAIRLAKFKEEEKGTIVFNGTNHEKSFGSSLYDSELALEEESDFHQKSIMLVFSTIFGVLGFFHMVLFIYYYKNRANLYYSLFSFMLFSVFFGMYLLFSGKDHDETSKILFLETIAVYTVPLFFLSILYEIFYKRLLKLFWILAALIFTALICFYSLDQKAIGIIIIVLFFIIAIVETIRVFIKAIVNKKDGARIFLFGLFFPIIGIIVLSLLSSFLESIGFAKSSDLIDKNIGPFFGYSFLLSVSLSMTFYLARDFARMNKKLLTQINEIRQLFNKTVEQDNERKKILENQNEKLEQMVVIRTDEVLRQKSEIELKNRDILDNLQYAKRIQEAILPEIKLIYRTLQDSFIIYIPKDIVSGDFYSFAQKNDRVIIAASDCTGHGVTGAFMSMIGTSLLNQIINENGVTQPAEILTDLNTGIVEALKQSEGENEVHDGMDIALCSIDLANTRLVYAGANRPLWFFKNGEMSLVKPTKSAIGGYQSSRTEEFTQHEIQLSKGDTIYLFTDGYADQFGGPEGKKMLSKRFREMLREIQNLPMNEQEKYLLKAFNDWKGNLGQVDDVLVIGVRL